MITVTRLNGRKMVLNAILIESVEETPDTMITLTTGKKFIVLEKATDVISLTKAYMRSIGSIRLAIKTGSAEEPEEL